MTEMINLCNQLINISNKILINYKTDENISLIEKQAIALEEKDKYISELENKLKLFDTNSLEKPNIKEQIIGFSPTKDKTPSFETNSDIVYKKVKHNNIRYYVVKKSGENPQNLYEILENNECGKVVGKRTKEGKSYKYIIN